MSSSFTFPSDVDEFEKQTAEDPIAFFGNITTLLHEYQQRAQTAEAREENVSSLPEEATGTIQRLRMHRDQLQAALINAVGLQVELAPLPPHYEPRSEKIPDLPRYNRSRALLPSFTLNLRAKLRTNPDRFLTETAKVHYASADSKARPWTL